MRKFIPFLLLICASGMAQAEAFVGKVIAVMDGDTILVARGNDSPIKVRLADIDAPEKSQAYGMVSEKSLQEMVLHKQVQISSKAVDDYGRLVADISVGNLHVNHEQVRRGMAWNFSRFRNRHELADLQREAQQARRGLWAGESAIEPSQWRKQHPAVPHAASSSSAASDAALQPNSGHACDKTRCAQMTSCEEARHYLTQCDVQTLDGDKDGMPCEKLCNPVVRPRQ